MSKRKKIFLITGIAAGLVLSVILLLILFGGEPEAGPDGLTEGETSQTGTDSSDRAEILPTQRNIDLFGQAPAREPNSAVLTQIATIFAERFNSYSNQNNNSHLKDAAALATERMADWIKTQTVEQASVYRGVTTRVYTAKVEELLAARAVVAVGAQVTTIVRDSRVSEFKTATVELVLAGAEWKVDRFVWNE